MVANSIAMVLSVSALCLLGLIPWRCARTVLGYHFICGGAGVYFFSFFIYISLTDKATDPSVSEQDWSAIQNFCDQVNTDPNG